MIENNFTKKISDLVLWPMHAQFEKFENFSVSRIFREISFGKSVLISRKIYADEKILPFTKAVEVIEWFALNCENCAISQCIKFIEKVKPFLCLYLSTKCCLF